MIRASVWLLHCCFQFRACHCLPVVRKAVARDGEATAESWARSKGISDKDIEKARQCLGEVPAG
jgi:hypothetical protein